MTSAFAPWDADATLSVARAARLLGVHPNTVRAWSDDGRLRYYRVNRRGDRRYRLADLQRFLAAAGARTAEAAESRAAGPLAAGARPQGARPQAVRADGRGQELSQIPLAAAATAPFAETRRSFDLQAVADVAAITARGTDLQRMQAETVRLLRERYGYRIVAALERRGTSLVPRAVDGTGFLPLVEMPATVGLLGRAFASGRPQLAGPADPGDRVLARHDVASEAAALIPGEKEPWGILLVGAEAGSELTAEDLELLVAVAALVSVGVYGSRLLGEVGRQLHRADALRRVAADITSKLDLQQILAGLVDHAMVLFEADRAGVFLLRPDGRVIPEVSSGLSEAYLAALPEIPSRSLGAVALESLRPVFSIGYRDDPRGASLRSAVIQEGFDTICAAPLADAGGVLGLLNLYHDRPHDWSDDDLETLRALATQATVAIRTAQNYGQMATWAAQLQSIQQLGARLDRLNSVHEIGLAIATELRQLIDYHNVRVYRIEGDELIPVAMKGQVGEYVDETVEQLRTKVGQGITGWVAAHGMAQNVPNAAADPRAMTIPGTADDLDESMLLAPMLYEDRVLGVLVLSKLGLQQFTDDDLRLLVIYASFAAQAMANADMTERLEAKSAALERQLQSQRDLLQITESILTTLDPTAILDQITERLCALVRYDNICIEVLDRAVGRLHPIRARGIHAAEYMADWAPGESGLATWVLQHGEPQLVVDERSDRRVLPFESVGPLDGSLIAVPLRGRDGVRGVLSLERLGTADRFTAEEFELVKLFAAQVSIALQNAEIHRAVEIRAQTDDLTGLLNQGTFHDALGRQVATGEPFSFIMLDLDDFKLVNDAAGHPAGDEFLRRAAAAIVAAGRESDSVFRYGGDEFAILLPGTESHGAAQVADRIRTALHDVEVPGGGGGAGIRISASIGVAAYPVDGRTAPTVLLAADRACYVAKRSGRDRIVLAAEGAVLGAGFGLQEPTPVDPPTPADPRRSVDRPTPAGPQGRVRPVEGFPALPRGRVSSHP